MRGGGGRLGAQRAGGRRLRHGWWSGLKAVGLWQAWGGGAPPPALQAKRTCPTLRDCCDCWWRVWEVVVRQPIERAAPNAAVNADGSTAAPS